MSKFLEIICLAGAISGAGVGICGLIVKNNTLIYAGGGVSIVSGLSLEYLDRRDRIRLRKKLYQQARREFNGSYLGRN